MQNVHSLFRSDGWENSTTGLGTTERDKVLGAIFRRKAELNYDVVESLFRDSDLVHRMVTLPAQEMTRAWFTLETKDPDHAKRIVDEMDAIDLRSEITQGIAYGRLWGGAINVLGVDDRQPGGLVLNTLDAPLSLESVRRLLWVQTYGARIDVEVRKIKRNQFARGYGRHDQYEVMRSTGEAYTAQLPYGQKIHESRTVLYPGLLTTRQNRDQRRGWDNSVVELLYETIRDFESAFQSVTHILADFSQAFLEIEDLQKLLVGDSATQVLERIQLIDMMRSTMRMIPVGKGEKFGRDTAALTGVSDVLDSIMFRLSAGSGIQATVLFGRAPAGMNSTGESDLQIWHNYIQSEQERVLRPIVDRYVLLIAKTLGIELDTWDVHFNPLWSPSKKEAQEISRSKSETIRGDIQARVISIMEGRAKLYPELEDPAADDDEVEIKAVVADPDVSPEAFSETVGPIDLGLDETVAEKALNGAQMSSLIDVMVRITAGEITAETAMPLLEMSFPDAPKEKIQRMIAGAKRRNSTPFLEPLKEGQPDSTT